MDQIKIGKFIASCRKEQGMTQAVLAEKLGISDRAVIIDVVYTMARDVVKKKKLLPVLIMVLSFAASYIFDINIMLILVFCAIIGLCFGRGEKKS